LTTKNLPVSTFFIPLLEIQPQNNRIMARPIKETPILYGEKAKSFAQRIEKGKPVSNVELDRMRKAYQLYLKIKRF
jgi:hypothetical protein